MKKIVIWFCLVTIIFVMGINSTNAEENELLVKPVEVFNLSNGQTVIAKEVHANPIVTIDTWVKTGSINEDDSNNGVSHFLEHLIFKGTEKYPTGKVDEILESKGAEFNAATSKDYTHFYVTIASEYFDLALPLHANMVLNAVIPESELEKERKVVLEEIRRAEDSPQRQVYYNLNDLLFKNHPYKYDTLGKTAVIKNISREKILEYYHKWYVPENIITVITGDINTQHALSLIKENFGTQQKNKMVLPDYSKEQPLQKTLQKVESGDYKQAYLELGFKAPSMKELKETFALDVAAIILGQGRASRLYKRLKQDTNLINSVYVSNFTMKDDGIFIFDFDLQPENLDKVNTIVLEEINKIKNEPVTNEELTRAKNQVSRDFIYSNESVDSIASSIGFYTTIGSLDDYINYVENINSVTANDIQDTANKYLNTATMAVSTLKPKNFSVKSNNLKQSDNKNNELNNNKNNSSDNTSNDIQKIILTNGLTLLIKSNTSNAVVSMNVYVKGGQLFQDKAGLANLTAALLLKGTDSRTAEDIARETDDLGINIGASASDDYIEVSVKSIKDDFPEAFMVLTDVLKNSVFKPEEINKVKESMVNSIKANEDSPMAYSIEKLLMNAYGNHPYGQIGEKVINELPKISREDIVNYYKKYFVPSNMVISVVGNIPADLVKRYIEQSWGSDLTQTKIETTTTVEPLKNNIIVKTPKDTEAASITMGWIASGIKEKDYSALKLINALLGSGLSSRLARNLREKNGMAYEVGSFFPSRMDKSVFVFYIGTDPKNINDVIKGFKEEIKKLQTELISDEDLNNSKQKLTGQFALAHETNRQQGFYLGWFESVGLGYEFDQKYPELVNQVSAQQIKDLANNLFSNTYVLSIVAPNKALNTLKE